MGPVGLEPTKSSAYEADALPAWLRALGCLVGFEPTYQASQACALNHLRHRHMRVAGVEPARDLPTGF